MSYEAFLSSKRATVPSVGITEPPTLSQALFPFQQDLVRWGLRRGRAALFADTGLGKTGMQLAWADAVARATGRPVIILTPLAVAAQTVREAPKFGIEATLCRDGSDVANGINVTNYDRLHRFDASAFGAVVLDESSCLKDFASATRNALMSAFRDAPLKLCCTATPSPNDYTELGNHAEFLGNMTRTEMLSMYFVHDGGSTQDWRLKGHAADVFWRWVCSWAALVRRPSDLGYEDGGFALPPLEMRETVVAATDAQARAQGRLFIEPAATLDDQRRARRDTLADRVAACAALVAAEPDEQWLIWCELNDESGALAGAIPGAVEVRGSDDPETKEQRLLEFADGGIRVLVSKPSICGHGLNFQRCARMAFVGLSHSFEQTYQAVRRCWRYGQTRPVHCHLVVAELEGAVRENLLRKQRDAERMAAEMAQHTAAIVRGSVRGLERDRDDYRPQRSLALPEWLT